MDRKISNSEWSSEEEEYSYRRNEILNKTSPRDIANAPFVYSTRQSLTAALTSSILVICETALFFASNSAMSDK